MSNEKYEKVAEETGYTVGDIKRGYVVHSTSYGVEVVQAIDALVGTEFQKFKDDTEAGAQALKDGLNVKLETEDKDLLGWYVVQ